MSPDQQVRNMIEIFNAKEIDRCLQELKDEGITEVTRWVRIVAPDHPMNPTASAEQADQKKYLLLLDPATPSEVRALLPVRKANE